MEAFMKQKITLTGKAVDEYTIKTDQPLVGFPGHFTMIIEMDSSDNTWESDQDFDFYFNAIHVDFGAYRFNRVEANER